MSIPDHRYKLIHFGGVCHICKQGNQKNQRSDRWSRRYLNNQPKSFCCSSAKMLCAILFALVASVFALSIQLEKYLWWPGVRVSKYAKACGESARHTSRSSLSFGGSGSASIHSSTRSPRVFLMAFRMSLFMGRIKLPSPIGISDKPLNCQASSLPLIRKLFRFPGFNSCAVSSGISM